MPHLPPDLHRALVGLLKSHLVTEHDRVTFLTGAHAIEALENRVIVAGTPLAFATDVVGKLSESELIAALSQLKLSVGYEQQSKVDSLCVQIRQSTGGGVILSQLIDRCSMEIGQVPPHILRLLLPSGIRSSAQSVAGLLREVGGRELPDETPRFLILSVLNRLEHYFRVVKRILRRLIHCGAPRMRRHWY